MHETDMKFKYYKVSPHKCVLLLSFHYIHLIILINPRCSYYIYSLTQLDMYKKNHTYFFQGVAIKLFLLIFILLFYLL